MITIKAKYNEKKGQTMTDRKVSKANTVEAIAIICEMYDLILKNTEGMTEKRLQKILKDAYKLEKGEE